jgi:hypothetical protein
MIGTEGRDPVRPASELTRRLAGLAVLVGVLMLIMVVAAVRGHTVVGEAVAQPVKAAPQIGDCVLEEPGRLGVNLNNLPVLRIERCSGPRYGEVAFLIGDFSTPRPESAPGPDQCGEQVSSYLGMPPLPPSDGSFAEFGAFGWTVVGPDARQRAAGQTWAACAAYVPNFSDDGVSVSVDHSLRGAWQRTEDSRLFGICIDDAAALEPAICRSAHRFELMGMAVGTPGIPLETLDKACRHIVVGALGSSAALDRGELDTQVLAVRIEPNSGAWITGPEAVSADSEYNNFCLATPTDSTRRLTAPLRGLGDGAVPLN